MTPITVAISLIHPKAQLPRFAHSPSEESGMDLFATDEVLIGPGEWAAVGTGLVFEIPPGYEGQIRPRSGLALRHGVTLLNSPGTLDPGYRGELRILMINHGTQAFQVRPGDRIAQLIVTPYAAVEWKVSPELTASARGSGGFGSTGV